MSPKSGSEPNRLSICEGHWPNSPSVALHLILWFPEPKEQNDRLLRLSLSHTHTLFSPWFLKTSLPQVTLWLQAKPALQIRRHLPAAGTSLVWDRTGSQCGSRCSFLSAASWELVPAHKSHFSCPCLYAWERDHKSAHSFLMSTGREGEAFKGVAAHRQAWRGGTTITMLLDAPSMEQGQLEHLSLTPHALL